MFDFRLNVFYTVAQRLSFTKAANELFISQPAVSKHIKEIEKHYQCKLFERTGNILQLTPEGKLLLYYAEKIFSLYKELNADLQFLNKKHHGFLRVGASTTAAQYVLPQYLASFRNSFPHISLELTTANTERIESLLNEKSIDIGIVEGKTKRRHLVYTPIIKDEIVLCTRSSNPTKAFLSVEEIRNMPLVIREKGSGTLEIIRSTLIKHNIKLDDLPIEIVLENNESIKNYLRHSNTFAFISISAILDELKSNQLKIVDIENISMERFYYFVSRQGEQSNTTELFQNFLLSHNLKL